MRKILLPVFGLAVSLVIAAGTGFAASSDDGAPRVISVSTHSGSPVHQRITLPLDKAVIVQIDADARDVLVSNPEIVDAVVRSPRRIFLMAKKNGQTNAFFFDGAGRQLASLDIRVEKDITDLSQLIHNSLPNSNVKVSAMSDNVVLSGKVENAQQAARAQEIATRFAGDPAKVVNMLQIMGGEQVMLKIRIAEMQRTVAKQFGIDLSSAMQVAGVPISLSTSNPFGLVGHALSDLSGGTLGSVCPAAFRPQTTSNTVSTLNTGNNTVQTLTNGSSTVNNVSNNPSLLEPGVATGITALASTVQTIATGVPTVVQTVTSNVPCASPNNIQGMVKALEQVGLVHMLAEPNLVAVSGETAKFLAGGEFPVPSGRDSQGNISITFKQFGVGLSFTPVVMSKGRISLQLSTEVSELTNTGAYTLQGSSTGGTTTGGLTIPALSVRRAETTIELPSGGSFAIAGLMQHNTKQVLDSFPGLKDMPVLGALFRSRDFQNDETELVVMATAYLVSPTTADKLASPTDGFVAPTDLETILLGRLNSNNARDKNPVTVSQGPAEFIVQ